jgi:hypothetical protein
MQPKAKKRPVRFKISYNSATFKVLVLTAVICVMHVLDLVVFLSHVPTKIRMSAIVVPDKCTPFALRYRYERN